MRWRAPSNCRIASFVLCSSLLRKSFQGDVLFSFVLQTTLLFKQHGRDKKKGETHFFHFQHVAVYEGGLGGGGWGVNASPQPLLSALGGKARKRE